ncbi:hypothetical protein dqs_2325 [Azoarcus olearius]|uniref:hypothetical protein n=1 Tax=Azoarcus sp. (strain BH72) TaxID=418699 RepID=UPI0008063CBE|nr:hypothetical protein [Azoarcus olearius]ANQ85356.1 hypothetical protein dqs_2325 [Azoarcus olearius]
MGNIATWLDLAIASARPADYRVRIHNIDRPGRGSCYALSVNNRWLHTGAGELTLFHGIGTALHFLKTAGVGEFEPGRAVPESTSCGNGNCFCLDKQRRLAQCAHRPR